MGEFGTVNRIEPFNVVNSLVCTGKGRMLRNAERETCEVSEKTRTLSKAEMRQVISYFGCILPIS